MFIHVIPNYIGLPFFAINTDVQFFPYTCCWYYYISLQSDYRLQITLKSQYLQVSASSHCRNGSAGS